jgi:phosphoribosyl 1,2-cyclic phosphodiesterase
VGNENEGILIDAGISCRETERRLKRLGLSIKSIRAIFITHEHADHISGLPKLVKRHYLPVYMTALTKGNMRGGWAEIRATTFKSYEPITVGSLLVTPIPKFHDAVDPHSFVVTHKNVNVGVFTDTGRHCENLVKSFQQCHAAFLESNYDDVMLETGGYPQHLKDRIRKGFGHLSNKEALQLFMNHRPVYMSHLILSHLSANNNKPEIVDELFSNAAGETKIIVASRRKETGLYQITGDHRAVISSHQKEMTQLSLF